MKTALSITALGCAAMVAFAQPPRTESSMSVDAKFLKGARSGGQFEIQSSKLAAQRATDPEVKQFAQRMIEDHTKVGSELEQIAHDANRSSAQLDPVHSAMLNKLSSEQGKEFDECYIGMQVLAHEEAIMCFLKEAKKGENAQLRAFAEKNLPALREHQQMVKKVCDRLIDGGQHESLKTNGR